MGPLIIAALLGLACALLVLQPLFGLDRAADGEPEQAPVALAEVAERERLAKQALLEVDFDRRLGNLDAADYADLKARYERRALAALKARFERERTLDEVIERQLDTLRKQTVAGKKSGRAKRPAGRTEADAATLAAVDDETSDAQSGTPMSAPEDAIATISGASGAPLARVAAGAPASRNGHGQPTTASSRDRAPRRRKGG